MKKALTGLTGFSGFTGFQTKTGVHIESLYPVHPSDRRDSVMVSMMVFI